MTLQIQTIKIQKILHSCKTKRFGRDRISFDQLFQRN